MTQKGDQQIEKINDVRKWSVPGHLESILVLCLERLLNGIIWKMTNCDAQIESKNHSKSMQQQVPNTNDKKTS